MSTKYHEGDIIGKYHDIMILSLDSEKYPPYIRKDGRKDRCGLFKNLKTGEEFVTLLDRALYKSSKKVSSLGEKRIAEILNENDIQFIEQKTYDDLHGFGGKPPAFDFYLLQHNVLVEYDGLQHLLSGHDYNMFGHTEEEYFIYYARDIIKESWCYLHEVPLLRIPYRNNLDDIDMSFLMNALELTKQNAKNNKFVTVYPDDKEYEYESVSVVMSHLDGRYQYEFYRILRDLYIDYRRPNDKPLEEDQQLLQALPHGSKAPVLFTEPLPLSFYKEKRPPIVIGDIIGNNGVKYLGDFDDDGNKIENTAAGHRRGLFECSCGKHFISSFNSVRGSQSNQYEGKLCDICTKKRRDMKCRETREKNAIPPKQYEYGEIVDPDGHFSFVKELEPTSSGRKFLVKDIESNEEVTYLLSTLRRGKALTIKEKQEKTEKQKIKRSYRKLEKGDIIGKNKALIMQEDLEYYTFDDSSKIQITVYNTLFNKIATMSLKTALSYNASGERYRSLYNNGDIVTESGTKFIEWCDVDGNSILLKEGEQIGEYARFECNCSEHNIFIAKWNAVRDRDRQCPKCMEKREKQSRIHNGLSRKLIFEPGIDAVDPNGRYIYLKEDTEATTKKRKVIVRDKETGEEFSYQFDKLRQGTVIPPSEVKKKRKQGTDKNQKYNIGDIVGKNQNIRIIGEMEPDMIKGSPVRHFIFKNLKTGYLFDSVLQPVKSGLVTGKRSKKTEQDYDSYVLINEEDTQLYDKQKENNKGTINSLHNDFNALTKDELEKLLANNSSSKIAEMYDLSFQTVCKRIKALGAYNPNTNAARQINVETMPLKEIEKRLDSGQSMTSIGKELGYTYAAMKKAVNYIEEHKKTK